MGGMFSRVRVPRHHTTTHCEGFTPNYTKRLCNYSGNTASILWTITVPTNSTPQRKNRGDSTSIISAEVIVFLHHIYDYTVFMCKCQALSCLIFVTRRIYFVFLRPEATATGATVIEPPRAMKSASIAALVAWALVLVADGFNIGQVLWFNCL